MEPENSEALRRLEIDQTLAEHGLDRRDNMRVAPGAEGPVLFNLGPDSYELRDLSTSGLSFYSQEAYARDFWLMGRLQLPAPAQPFEITVQIISCETNGLVRCRFMEIQPHEADQVSAFIQKRIDFIARPR